MAAWRSGNDVAHINKVYERPARLVPRLVPRIEIIVPSIEIRNEIMVTFAILTFNQPPMPNRASIKTTRTL